MRSVRSPLLMLFIIGGWLALADPITPGQVVLAGVMGFGGSWLMSRLQLAPSSPSRPRVALRLTGLVLSDIVRSNIAVARIILKRSKPVTANFLMIPLDLRNRTGLAVLACIITATPGTIWVSYDAPSGRLLLHILDLVDETEWLHTIKNRYERLLMEIFE